MHRLFKNIFLLALPFTALLYSCKKKTAVIEFEGIITYKVSYANFQDTTLYGDTLKIYYSKGNLLKLYNGKSRTGIKKEVFLAAGDQYYFIKNNSDTVFSYDITQHKNFALTSTRDSIWDSKILGHSCKAFKMTHARPGAKTLYVYDTYVYADSALRVSPTRFGNFKYGDFDRFISESGSFYLHYKVAMQIEGNPLIMSKTLHAISIQPQKIDQGIFTVNTTHVQEFKD